LLNSHLKPTLILKSNTSLIPNLILNKELFALGVAWLNNEGDLNGDGGDDISVIIGWGDF